MPSMEKTLVVIKPDGLKKSLTGNVLTRLSEGKLRIIAAKIVRVSRDLAEKHYEHLQHKPFFEDVVKYLMGELHGKQYSRVMALVYSGPNAIKKVRELAGTTNPETADPTSIRGQYGRLTTTGLFENVLHCSDNAANAKKEIQLWFEPDEIVDDIFPTKKEQILTVKHIWK